LKFRSQNIYGWSLNYSPVNTIGATIRVVPEPVAWIFVNSIMTTTTQITVYWDDFTNDYDRGDSEITSFNLQWDIGTDGAEWADL
jgi:hypothetical protein